MRSQPTPSSLLKASVSTLRSNTAVDSWEHALAASSPGNCGRAGRGAKNGRGIEVGEVFHDAGGLFHHSHEAGEVVHHEGQARVAGPHPDRADYGSYAAFGDPDGNGRVSRKRKSGPRPLTPLSGTHGRDGEQPLQPLGAPE